MKLLVIDNYDSFTFNLVQYFGMLGVEQKVFRNDQITVEEALAFKPDRVLISPGPCSPSEAGVSLEVIEAFKRGEASPITIEELAANAETTFAIVESMRTGQAVDAIMYSAMAVIGIPFTAYTMWVGWPWRKSR